MGIMDKTRIMYDFNEDYFTGLEIAYNALKFNIKTKEIRQTINNQLISLAMKSGMKIPVFISRYYSKFVDVKGRPLRKTKGSYHRKQLTIDTAQNILKEALCNYIDKMSGVPFEQIVVQDEQIDESPSVKKLLKRKAVDTKTFTYRNIYSFKYWADVVGGLGKHKYPQPFKCYCCGQIIGDNLGWRIEPTDYCFCDDCLRQIENLSIIKDKNKGGKPIIYTPMGNKR